MPTLSVDELLWTGNGPWRIARIRLIKRLAHDREPVATGRLLWEYGSMQSINQADIQGWAELIAVSMSEQEVTYAMGCKRKCTILDQLFEEIMGALRVVESQHGPETLIAIPRSVSRH